MLLLTSLVAVARATIAPVMVAAAGSEDTQPKPSCVCQDPAVDALRDLMRQGFSQWDASLIVFSGSTGSPVDESPLVWRAKALLQLRKHVNAARRSLRLPLIPETVTLEEARQ